MNAQVHDPTQRVTPIRNSKRRMRRPAVLALTALAAIGIASASRKTQAPEESKPFPGGLSAQAPEKASASPEDAPTAAICIDVKKDPAEPGSTQTSPKIPAKKGWMTELASWMMKQPALKDRLRERLRCEVAELYGDLLREWRLEGPRREEVEALLLDRLANEIDLRTLLEDPETTTEQFLRHQETLFTETDERLSRLLSPAQNIRLEAYESSELPRQILSKQADQLLIPLHLPEALHGQVRLAMIEAEQETGNPIQTPLIRRRTAGDVQSARGATAGPKDKLNQLRQSNAHINARIQYLLSPEQFETFRRNQAGELRKLEVLSKLIPTN